MLALEAIRGEPPPSTASDAVIGVFPGEGIGPEVVGAALHVLAAVEAASGTAFDVRIGGPIGLEAEAQTGRALPEAAERFCADVFASNGAVLAGAGGGRFVYDLRKRFDLYCKLSPLRVWDELAGIGPLTAEHVSGVDVLAVRETSSGVYVGRADEGSEEGRVEHVYGSSAEEVLRVLRAAGQLALSRRGRLSVVVKQAGVPSVSQLWRKCAEAVAHDLDISLEVLDVDYAAYKLVREPRELDVVAAPNLFGDILSDVGGVLLGARGLTYGGTFAASGWAVYGTNHGAAFDIAGSDQANPGGQILALAMLLRESFALEREARLIEAALCAVWRDGVRTADLARSGHPVVGTHEFARRTADAVATAAVAG